MANPITVGLKRINATLKGFFVRDENATERCVFDTDGNLYQRNEVVMTGAGALNALYENDVIDDLYMISVAGVADNGDIVVPIPFTATGWIVQGWTTAGAPIAITDVTFAGGNLTIDVAAGAVTDRWDIIAWNITV